MGGTGGPDPGFDVREAGWVAFFFFYFLFRVCVCILFACFVLFYFLGVKWVISNEICVRYK